MAAAKKPARRAPSPKVVHLELDFGGPVPSLTRAPAPMSPVDVEPEAGSGPAAGEKPSVSGEAVSPTVLTVTQLTRRVRRMLEQHLGLVWVEGELSNVRRMANGHAYFTLKDAGAQLSCVLFRGHAHAGMPDPEDGRQVRVSGEITVYEPRGQYQLVVHTMEEAGLGALQAKFEALKRRLAAEGLFDPARKRSLPAYPSCVALVTSPGGAALRDMLHILGRRAPWVRVLIFPVRVQGDGAAAEIATALRQLAVLRIPDRPRPDVIVVGRGGGSIEDLWCFNEEIVARAIAASPIPVVSAVGHEIDFTIADFAADLRALTPSAAAELIVPDAGELRRRFGGMQRTMRGRVRQAIDHARIVLDLQARGGLAREPRRLLSQFAQQTDDLADDLKRGVRGQWEAARERVRRASQQLAAQRPSAVLAQRQQTVALLASRLGAHGLRQLTAARERWQRSSSVLRSLGPQSVLTRGFTYTLGPDGRPLTDVTALKPGDRLTTRTTGGSVTSVVEGKG